MEESPVKKDMDKESDVNQKNIVKDSEANDSNNKREASDDFENKSNSEVLPQYCDKNAIKGKAVFVVNKFEKNVDLERKGAERDLDYLKHIFIDKLGFEQLNINKELNLSKSELYDVLKDTTSNMDYTDTDIFVFAISTHGEERPKQTDEYEHALMCEDEEYVFTSDIINKFCCKHSLDGKPKLFFIQACRIPYGIDSEKDANIYDPGHKILIKDANEEKNEEVLPARDKEEQRQESENYQTKKYFQEKADAGHRKEEEVENQPCLGAQGQSSFPLFSSICCPKDCLVVYAIQSGKIAWRSEVTGSWMFHELSEVIKRYDKSSPVDFFDILTKTAFGMAQRESNTEAEVSRGKKSVPVIQHRLIKGLLIPLVKRV